jgi:predicted GIY-YIG superfamily endonuclease
MATTILKSKNINALKKEKRLKQTNKQKKKKKLKDLFGLMNKEFDEI